MAARTAANAPSSGPAAPLCRRACWFPLRRAVPSVTLGRDDELPDVLARRLDPRRGFEWDGRHEVYRHSRLFISGTSRKRQRAAAIPRASGSDQLGGLLARR